MAIRIYAVVVAVDTGNTVEDPDKTYEDLAACTHALDRAGALSGVDITTLYQSDDFIGDATMIWDPDFSVSSIEYHGKPLRKEIRP